MARVVIICKSLPHYRVPFFEGLRQHLAQEGVELILVYGSPAPSDEEKQDTMELAWGCKVQCRFFRLGGTTLIWQPTLRYLRPRDLVIVEQASKLLVNYVLFALHRIGIVRLAFWGHGRNLQGRAENRFGEALKRWLSRRVHWWFAYCESSARIVSELGFPDEKVTRVQNAIDTSELKATRQSLTGEELDALRAELHLVGDHVAVFSGGLYSQKRLSFLIDVAVELRGMISDFELLVLGGGPDAYLIEAAARDHSWIHYLGPTFGRRKVACFALADVLLMPGLVGLVILDSFALRVPLITTAIEWHSPEIEYLRNGENGVMLSAATTPKEFAIRTQEILSGAELAQLRHGCEEAARLYTLDTMVHNFARGILSALAIEKVNA